MEEVDNAIVRTTFTANRKAKLAITKPSSSHAKIWESRSMESYISFMDISMLPGGIVVTASTNPRAPTRVGTFL
jgi:hypothetical protein